MYFCMGSSSLGFSGTLGSSLPFSSADRILIRAAATSVFSFSSNGVLSRRRVGEDGWNIDSCQHTTVPVKRSQATSLVTLSAPHASLVTRDSQWSTCFTGDSQCTPCFTGDSWLPVINLLHWWLPVHPLLHWWLVTPSAQPASLVAQFLLFSSCTKFGRQQTQTKKIIIIHIKNICRLWKLDSILPASLTPCGITAKFWLIFILNKLLAIC